jgi:two-component system response regulator HupR/HoxA
MPAVSGAGLRFGRLPVSSDPVRTDEPIEGARRHSGGNSYEILIVVDDAARLESLELALGTDYRVHTATRASDGLEILERAEIALLLADEALPSMAGVDFLKRAREIRPLAIRMLLSRGAELESLNRAVNEALVYCWIAKPWGPNALRLAVRRALESYELASQNIELGIELGERNKRLDAENADLRREIEHRYAFDRIIGTGPAMERVFGLIEKVAMTDSSVLISGEPGTGKGVVARAIHYAGARSDKRFMAQNCAALPDTLLESELFGHKRGAFTGAKTDKEGLFGVANGGTAFLEEVGETHPGMQVRLLRVLQDGEIRTLGSSDTRVVDVRVIASTSRDLLADVGEGRFREDLFYRLRVVEIRLPPLRERKTDVPALACRFLEAAGRKSSRGARGFANAAMDCLVRYRWPDNVRELEDEIERAVAVSGGAEQITAEMLSEHIRSTPVAATLRGDFSTDGLRLSESVDALKRRMILEAIAETGSKTRASEKLGIPRQSLQKMMKRLDLQN